MNITANGFDRSVVAPFTPDGFTVDIQTTQGALHLADIFSYTTIFGSLIGVNGLPVDSIVNYPITVVS